MQLSMHHDPCILSLVFELWTTGYGGHAGRDDRERGLGDMCIGRCFSIAE